MAENGIKKCSLFTRRVVGKNLSEAIEAFFAVTEIEAYVEKAKNTFAIFYAPHKCFLAKRKGKDFEVKEKGFDLTKVFEARIFNEIAEMRWLNSTSGSHSTAILSETQLSFNGEDLKTEANIINKLPQKYLIWGQSTGNTNGSDWTEFATARLGSFYVPLPTVPKHDYVRIGAIEYLKEYDDGNVAVFDERLRGIEGYKGESQNA